MLFSHPVISFKGHLLKVAREVVGEIYKNSNELKQNSNWLFINWINKSPSNWPIGGDSDELTEAEIKGLAADWIVLLVLVSFNGREEEPEEAKFHVNIHPSIHILMYDDIICYTTVQSTSHKAPHLEEE